MKYKIYTDGACSGNPGPGGWAAIILVDDKIKDEILFAYGVYQIEAEGRSLFSKIEGDENSIMGLPVKKIKEYLDNLK